MIHVERIVEQSIKHIQVHCQNRGRASGVPTGFVGFDKLTSGLQPSELIVAAGRPAMGVSTFCFNIVERVAVDQAIPVAVFSLDMSREVLVRRMLCSMARIDIDRLRAASLTAEDWHQLRETEKRLKSAPLYIEDDAMISIDGIADQTRRLKETVDDLGLLIVDPVESIGGASRTASCDTVRQSLQSLKLLAVELKIPVLVAASLPNTIDERHDKRPTLSDLNLVAEADMVLFLFRESYYDPTVGNKNASEIKIAKQNIGPVANVEVRWDGNIGKFFDASVVTGV